MWQTHSVRIEQLCDPRSLMINLASRAPVGCNDSHSQSVHREGCCTCHGLDFMSRQAAVLPSRSQILIAWRRLVPDHLNKRSVPLSLSFAT
jgi:hypothetical protein